MSDTFLFGGSGFFGPIILENYQDIVSVGRTRPPAGITNRYIQLDSLDDLSILDKEDFDKVIFLIGNSNHHEINKRATMGLDYNVLPLTKALHYLKDRDLKKFIAFTGALLYDQSKITLPVDESQSLAPYKNQYIFSKYLAEETTKLYPSVPTINVRLSNIYGPTRLIRPDVVPKIMYQAFSPSEEITVWNTKPQRDFVYAGDVSKAVVSLLETDYTGPINVGSGEMHSVGEVAEIVAKLSGKKVKSLDKEVSGPMEFKYNTSLLQKLTNWSSCYDLESGLKQTYNIMKSYADEYRWWEKTSF